MNNSLKLQKKIMRRVYLAFALRLVQHPIVLQLGTFALALVLFAKLVHVHRVLQGLESTSNVPQFLYNTFASALMRGEVLTLIVVGVLIFTALSVPWGLYRTFAPRLAPRLAHST